MATTTGIRTVIPTAMTMRIIMAAITTTATIIAIIMGMTTATARMAAADGLSYD
jgi:hypothetical protein